MSKTTVHGSKGYYDKEKDRVYIKFKGHPGYDVNKKLVNAGFSYSTKNKYYYAEKNNKTETLSLELVEENLNVSPPRKTDIKPKNVEKEVGSEKYVKEGYLGDGHKVLFLKKRERRFEYEPNRYDDVNMEFTIEFSGEHTTRRGTNVPAHWKVEKTRVTEPYYRGSRGTPTRKYVGEERFPSEEEALKYVEGYPGEYLSPY